MDTNHNYGIWKIVVGTFLLAGLLGCGATSERYHPQYAAYTQKLHTLLLLPPEVSVFEELADGSMLRQEEASQNARSQIQSALVRSLTAKRFVLKTADSELIRNPEPLSIQSLFRAVNRSIQLHTYGPQLFPSKIQSFDYEMGPIDELLKKAGADALVLSIGHQTLSSNQPTTWVSMAVVEPQGHIIWYDMQGAQETLGIQNREKAQILVDSMVKRFAAGTS